MKKPILLLLVVLFLVGCRDVLFEQSVDASASEAEMSFRLDSKQPVYDISVSVRYSYGLGRSLDKVEGVLTSPSGKIYSRTRLLSAGKSGSVGSKSVILNFEGVTREEGEYFLKVKKETGKTKLKKVTLKAYAPK